MSDPTAWIEAVRSSHENFAALVAPLSETQVQGPSYDTEWTIAQVASHLGSQAEIFGLFLDAGLAGAPAPGGEVFGPIWDRWNALPPAQQVTESVTVNGTLVSRIEAISEAERQSFTLSMFGSEIDLAGFAALRLGEHAVHTWDIAVMLDPEAAVAPEAVELLVDRLGMPAGRSGKAIPDAGPMVIETVEPERRFVLSVDPEVSLVEADTAADEALQLPAEALIRLVYGRLDPDHSPEGVVDLDRLAQLRQVFPGF